MPVDKKKKDSDGLLNFWKNEIPMSSQKTFVSPHKEYFWLCDRSETSYERSQGLFCNILIINLPLLIFGYKVYREKKIPLAF
jgi:hypothetical protein